ncbi:MAG: glycosyltransferase family 2 protein [PVC group bacterium]|nr:glycosyltransferase family 2 protein [PVC group bacterium]
MTEKISILIPCYNEAENIINCIQKIPPLNHETEIIVIDDGSSDKTAQVAKTITPSEINVIEYKKNRGKGFAIRTGLQHATGDIGIILDADYTSPPLEIPKFIAPIINKKADFVNGSRFIYPFEKGAFSVPKILGNKLTARIFSLALKQPLTDTLCGMKAFRIPQLIDKLQEDSWPDFELLVQAKRNKMKIMEIAIPYAARKAGASKMVAWKSLFKLTWLIIKSLFHIR